MTAYTPEEIGQKRLVRGSLPGEPVPYYVASGDGMAFETAGQLWTVIARAVDTGDDFDAAYITGRRGAESPLHAIPSAHRTFVVLDGRVQIWLGAAAGEDAAIESRILSRGDSVVVPEGVLFGYRMRAEASRLFLFSAPGGTLDDLLASGRGTSSHIYSPQAGSDSLILPANATRLALPDTDPRDAADDRLPEGCEPYVLRSLEGEHRAWPDALNSYVSRARNTDGRYFSVDTLAAPQPYIIRHFHRQHTENFLCLSGRVWLWVNGEEVLLTEGDFLHAPAGTIHSFAIAGHNTRMLGFLTTGIFEPFFDVTSQHTDDKVYTEGLVNPSVIFEGIKGNPDLDLEVVGPPPERVFAPGL
ncbi:cupin domain-containing protein [Microbacterium suaedae]|uniref:cupin domain-containing protein n=1 Tax=Microbacterium suaedae TaxID=2067813 RepID=UPI000DA1B098|nr:cupin domain-containing protein [Microbacterium suaedae]